LRLSSKTLRRVLARAGLERTGRSNPPGKQHAPACLAGVACRQPSSCRGFANDAATRQSTLGEAVPQRRSAGAPPAQRARKIRYHGRERLLRADDPCAANWSPDAAVADLNEVS
jgi:hypothetical protein